MNTFIRFLYEFISIFFDGLFAGIKGFFSDVFSVGDLSKV